MTPSAEPIELRRKRLLWRSSHRGIKEMDLLMGGFARSRLPTMTESELSAFEALIDLPDQELLSWFTGEAAVPSNLGNATPARTPEIPPMIDLSKIVPRLGISGRIPLSGVPHGLDAMLLPRLAQHMANVPLLHVCVDDQRLSTLAEQIAFFAPDLEVLRFPAWDCLPYDRVSPSADVLARRLSTLTQLNKEARKPRLVLATVNAVLQRVMPREAIGKSSFTAAPGNRVNGDALQAFLAGNGFSRVGTVVDPGDFAVRGGIIDIFPPGAENPVRLDFFGDTLESIREFDAQSQRSNITLKTLTLNLANEVLLSPEAIGRFRTGYAAAFGGLDLNDPLYESVTNGRRYQGMEHWMPLFHERLETLLDYLPGSPISAGSCHRRSHGGAP